jgi:hypothetical protein
MTNQSTTAPLPSMRTLAITTAIALGLAAVILVTTVLPAEYGIDPLGTGEALGLTAIARPEGKSNGAPSMIRTCDLLVRRLVQVLFLEGSSLV